MLLASGAGDAYALSATKCPHGIWSRSRPHAKRVHEPQSQLARLAPTPRARWFRQITSTLTPSFTPATPSTSMRKTLSVVALSITWAACDTGPSAVTLEPPKRHRVLQSAEDSAAALRAWQVRQSQSGASTSLAQVQALAGVSVSAGDAVVVTVTSANTGRCEQVDVQGAISQGLFAQVGTCNGVPYNYGVGQTVTIGPATVDGVLTFGLPLAGGGASLVSGAYPAYTVALDDAMYDFDYNDVVLKVEIQSEPKLACTATERGAQVSCNVTPASIPVQGWKFRGGHATITAPGGSSSWSGPAVIGGDVEAVVLYQGAPKTLQATFTVSARRWQWGKSDWTYADGAAAMVGGGDIAPAKEVNWLAGWNCTMPDCTRGWILPDLAKGETGGYAISRVPSGPNEGFWFVSRADFRIERGSNYNPHIQPGASPTYTLPAAQASACTAIGAQPDGSVLVNWYDYNKLCRGIAVDPWLAAVRAHEGYGTLGTNGHQSQGELAAADPRNDPRRLLEGLYTRNQADLDDRVRREVSRAEARIARAGGSEPTTNHPAFTMWVWSYQRNRMDTYNMNRI